MNHGTDIPQASGDQSQQTLDSPGGGGPHCASGPWGRTALHVAVCRNDVEAVQQLVAVGASSSLPDKQHWTPLHLSAVRGLDEVCHILLQHGADVSARDLMGRTPLHFTARSGSAAVARHLLDYGALVSAVDTAGRTALHDAAIRGSAELVALFLQHSDDPRKLSMQADARGMVPLQCAAHRGHAVVVKQLLPVLLKAPADDADALLISSAVAAAQSSYMQVAAMLVKELGRKSPAAVSQVLSKLHHGHDGHTAGSSSALLSAVVLDWIAECAGLQQKRQQLQTDLQNLEAARHSFQGLCIQVPGMMKELQGVDQEGL